MKKEKWIKSLRREKKMRNKADFMYYLVQKKEERNIYYFLKRQINLDKTI